MMAGTLEILLAEKIFIDGQWTVEGVPVMWHALPGALIMWPRAMGGYPFIKYRRLRR